MRINSAYDHMPFANVCLDNSAQICIASELAITTVQVVQERSLYKTFRGFAFPMGPQLITLVLIALCVLASGIPTQAQVTATWTGNAHDSLWTDKNNWNPHAVPGSNDTAIINLSGSNLVILNTNLFIGTIALGGGPGTNILELRGVSIQCTGSISISNNGVLKITASSLVLGGSVQNSGAIMVPANLGTQTLTL